MSEWVPQDDWSQVKVGDTVRVKSRAMLLEGAVIDLYALAGVGYVNYFVEIGTLNLQAPVTVSDDWSLFVPAKPAVELPNEPGWYLDNKGDVWELQKETVNYVRRWFFNGEYQTEFDAIGCTPFTKLEPVAATAKKVLDQFRLGKSIPTVAEMFGVTQ